VYSCPHWLRPRNSPPPPRIRAHIRGRYWSANIEVRGFYATDFFLKSSPLRPDNNLRVILNFFENLRRYSQVKVHHRYQLDIGGK
jgi:hypothetical protein